MGGGPYGKEEAMRAGLLELERAKKIGGNVGNGVVLVGFQQNPAAAQSLQFLALTQNVVFFEYHSDSLAQLHRPCKIYPNSLYLLFTVRCGLGV